MKMLFQFITLLCLTASCHHDEPQIRPSSLAIIKYGGAIETYGCGWLFQYNSELYKAYELPESLQIDNLHLYTTFAARDEIAYCLSPLTIPHLEITEKLSSNLAQFYWAETQCDDPWQRVPDAQTSTDVINNMVNYLKGESIEVKAVKLNESNSGMAFCTACACGTGRSFSLWVNSAESEKMTALGFSPMLACDQKDPTNSIDWLREIVVQFDENMSDNSARITQYEYKSQCVFVIEDCFQCPDALTYVYDENKNLICEFGGIDGRNSCPDFFEQATNRIELYASINN